MLHAQDSQSVKQRTAIALTATLIFLATAPSLFAQSMSALIVCVTDTTNSPLPGTTVVASASGVRHTALADDHGCYEFSSLPPNSYRVTARLLGFDNATKGKIQTAQGKTVQWMILREGFAMVAAGLVLGLLLALATGKIVSGILFEVSSTDPFAFTLAPTVLVFAALLATWIPARRATKISPMAALRTE